MVDQLADEYAGQPVVFLEQDVDNPVGQRYGRWWVAYGSGAVTLPIVMVDSGHQITNGYEDFYSVYKSMVDSELARPPEAEITAYHERIGDTLYIYGEATNRSGSSLSSFQNDATLHALIYEEAQIGSTSRFVHAAPYSSIDTELAPGGTMTFTLSATLSGVNWDNVHAVALVDYRPGDGAYDMLQASVAEAPAFTVQPNVLTFLVDPADSTDPSISLSFEGPHTLNWTASETLDWLDLSSLNGAISEHPVVSANPVALSSGWQSGCITFTATSASGLHFEVQVPVNAYYGSLERVYLPLVMR